MNEQSKPGNGIPLWAKIMLGLVVVTIIGAAILAFFLFQVAKDFSKSVTNPDKANTTLHQIVRFDDPLPSGWGFVSQIDVGPMKMVSVNSLREHTAINIMQLPSNSSHMTAEQMIDKFATESSRSPLLHGVAIQSRGEETIGGMKMYYARTGPQQRAERGAASFGTAQMQTGYVVLPTGKVIMIQVMETQRDYDPAAAQPIFDKIKGFVD